MTDLSAGTYKPIWKNRRRVIFGSLGFIALTIVYLVGWGSDTEVNQTIAFGLLVLAGAIIGSYVFGAAWDDKNVLASLKR